MPAISLRLLHTADWHLGQSFHGFDRQLEHEAFLTWLLDTLVQENVDALLVAGDVFDTANPSAASQQQFYRFLTAARARVPHLNVVVIAGNHDSPGRLEAPSPFLALLDAVVVGQVQRNATGEVDYSRLVVPLKNRQGEVAAWCLAIPFLRPGDLPTVPDPAAENAYAGGVARLYAGALAAALARRRPGQALVAMGHCLLAGGQMSLESERPLVIGSAEALPAGLFDPAIAYAALGHLHKAQTPGEGIRYSGSPLPLSFSEIGYPHQVLRVDLEGASLLGATALPVPRPVQLLRVPTRHAPLSEVLARLENEPWPAAPAGMEAYLEVRVLLSAPEPNLRAQIEAVLAGKPVRLARIDTRTARSEGTAPPTHLGTDELQQLAPAEIFAQLYQQRYGEAPPPDLGAAFAELLDAAGQMGGDAA